MKKQPIKLLVLFSVLSFVSCGGSNNVSSTSSSLEETSSSEKEQTTSSSIEETPVSSSVEISTPVISEHQVTIKDVTHGKVSVSQTSYYPGSEVTFKISPDNGYVIDYYTVTTTNGEEVTLDLYTFTMPNDDVVIEASFKACETMYVPMIAHRGYSQYNVDNTEKSFVEAGKRSFYGMETDLRFTKDGVMVCNHDGYIMSGGNKYNIADYTWEEFTKLPIDNTLGVTDAYLCSFYTFINVCKKYNKHPIIEFKTTPDKNAMFNLLDYLTENVDYADQCIFISFGIAPLQMVKSYGEAYYGLSDVKCQYLFEKEDAAYTGFADGIGGSAVYTCVTSEMIAKYKEANMELGVWTVNDLYSAKKMQEMGVDYITSNWIENY